MSHTVKQKSGLKDEAVIRLACARLGAEFLGRGDHSLYDGTRHGIGIQLKDWNYPVVISDSGELMFDDFNGSWGNVEDLDKLKQAYSASAGYVAYGKKGRIVETELPNGELKLEIIIGGPSVVTGGGGSATGPGGLVLG